MNKLKLEEVADTNKVPLTEDEIMNKCQEAWQKEKSADKSRVVILP
jgi:hypothetical protein